MSKSKNTNPNVFRKNWDMPHHLETDYSRSRSKKELEEIVNENSGSISDGEDEDLKPFWECGESEGEQDSEEEVLDESRKEK